MEAITVNVVDLKGKLKENRSKHRAIFEEAVEGYRKAAVELLEAHIARIKNGKLERVMVQLPLPEDHTLDYDRVLAMLDMHIEDTIDVEEHDFQSYVLDDWTWKRQFLTSSADYSPTAAAMLAS